MDKRKANLWGFFLVLFPQASSFADNPTNDCTKISGFLVHTHYRVDANLNRIPRGANEHRFEIEIQGDQWKLRRIDLSMVTGDRKGWAYAETACDGQDIYYIRYYPEVSVKNLPGKKDFTPNRPLKVYNEHAIVSPGIYPDAGPLVHDRMVWLSFASSGFFETNTGLLPPFAFDTPFFKKFKYERELNPTNGSLSKFSTFAPTTIAFRKHLIDSNSPFPYEISEYSPMKWRAETFTNHGGTWFPSKFVMEQLLPFQRQGVAATNVSVSTTIGQISKIESCSETSLPNMRSSVDVYDMRLLQHPTTYVITNKTWLTRNDTNFIERMLALGNSYPSPPITPAGPKKPWFLLVIASTLIVFIPIYLNIRKSQIGIHP